MCRSAANPKFLQGVREFGYRSDMLLPLLYQLPKPTFLFLENFNMAGISISKFDEMKNTVLYEIIFFLF